MVTFPVDENAPVVEPSAVTAPGRPRRPSTGRKGLGAITAAAISIENSNPSGPEAIEVDLVGMTYQVTPPKTAYAMKIAFLAADPEADPDAVLQALDGWIEKAFGDQADDVRGRLFDDENDPLDFPHIMLLMQKLIERSSGLPTTPR